MTIEKLKYLYAIARYNNISKATSELHVNKSTLSTSLRDSENELGHLLLNRNGNSLTSGPYDGEVV